MKKKDSELADAIKAASWAAVKNFKDSIDFKKENLLFYDSGFEGFRAKASHAFPEPDFSKILYEDDPPSISDKEDAGKEEDGDEASSAAGVD